MAEVSSQAVPPSRSAIVDGRNGIVFPSEDVEALARAVDEFFTTRDRAAMEEAAVASARRYSWECSP